MTNLISEDQIERSCIELCTNNLKYDKHFNCFTTDHLGRKDETEVLATEVLLRKIKQINTHLTDIAGGISNEEAQQAVAALTDYDCKREPKAINQKMMNLIRNGVEVGIRQKSGAIKSERVQFIDWKEPEKNSFWVVNQLWIQGEVYRLRPDLLIYVNGIPLVTIELKNSNVSVETAYSDNLTRYKQAIPQLFVYNALLIVSNGPKTKVGATHASWEYFAPWLRADDEAKVVDKERIEQYGCSLDYAVLGLLDKHRLLDYVQNFMLFYLGNKICAKNHQFLGVNNAIKRFDYLQNGTPQPHEVGKMGVFWHTQGSGKSFSMVFLARKIVRQFAGNFTFLIITDREDLNDQIYRNFLHSGFMGEQEACMPKNSSKLREMLQGNSRILFTLIQKFRFDKGKEYPLLSDRKDIIIFIDEAHRTQYKNLAENLRIGLPHAQYMAFTGTPLFGSKKLTNHWFGENVSEYNFMQAVEDEATVPIVYKNHLPEVKNYNVNLTDELAEIVEEENLTEQERDRLEQQHATELSILKTPARLDIIAKDIAKHFPRRGYLGKGMVVSVDKFTVVRMYNLVQHYWQEEIHLLQREINGIKRDHPTYGKKLEQLNWMKKTEMAVVVSEEAGENEKFEKEGLNIKIHRTRMNQVNEEGQELQDEFKAPENPLRLVFVCTMWLTGFDAKTVSTLYLDKPMKGHTLMQTIARANRKSDYSIFGKLKEFGQVVAYCNVLNKLKEAISVYGGTEEGEEDKEEGTEIILGGDPQKSEILYEQLQETIVSCVEWCKEKEIDLTEITRLDTVFGKIAQFDYFADKLIGERESRVQFNAYDNTITALYDACLPEIYSRKKEFKMAEVIHYLRGVMDRNIDRGNLESARHRIEELINNSVLPKEKTLRKGAAEGVTLYGIRPSGTIDLSQLDVKKLKEEFTASSCPRREIEDICDFLEKKVEVMLAENQERKEFAERLQEIIERYNSGSINSEAAMQELIDMIPTLTAEQQRATQENLTEEELELFDILKKEDLNKTEKQKVKEAAKELLTKIKILIGREYPANWYSDSMFRMRFKDSIGNELDRLLPQSYDKTIFTEKKERIYTTYHNKAMQGYARYAT
ncbi:MAG: type I restriction endonuclease subunit R [Phocaeicola sp.]